MQSSLYLFIPYHDLAPRPLPFSLVTTSLFPHICGSVSALPCTLLVFLDSTDKWCVTVFVSILLISLSIILSRSIHIAARGRISFPFIGWVIVHCMSTHHISLVHSCWWTMTWVQVWVLPLKRGVASCGNQKCGGIWLFWGKVSGVWFQVVLVVKSLALDAEDRRDVGLTPGLKRSLGEGQGNPRQYSCLGNPMDRETW